MLILALLGLRLMRDILLVLLILALGVGWFSVNGTAAMAPDSSGIGPGDDRMGGSPLVVSGQGAEIVTVTQGGESERQKTAEQAAECGDAPETMPETAEEVTGVELFLNGCAVGVAAVMLGLFAGPVVAWLWQKINKR